MSLLDGASSLAASCPGGGKALPRRSLTAAGAGMQAAPAARRGCLAPALMLYSAPLSRPAGCQDKLNFSSVFMPPEARLLWTLNGGRTCTPRAQPCQRILSPQQLCNCSAHPSPADAAALACQRRALHSCCALATSAGLHCPAQHCRSRLHIHSAASAPPPHPTPPHYLSHAVTGTR